MAWLEFLSSIGGIDVEISLIRRGFCRSWRGWCIEGVGVGWSWWLVWVWVAEVEKETGNMTHRSMLRPRTKQTIGTTLTLLQPQYNFLHWGLRSDVGLNSYQCDIYSYLENVFRVSHFKDLPGALALPINTGISNDCSLCTPRGSLQPVVFPFFATALACITRLSWSTDCLWKLEKLNQYQRPTTSHATCSGPPISSSHHHQHPPRHYSVSPCSLSTRFPHSPPALQPPKSRSPTTPHNPFCTREHRAPKR